MPQTTDETAYSIDQKVALVYDRSNPTEVAAANASALPLLWPLVLLCAGAAWLVVGIVFVRRRAAAAAANPERTRWADDGLLSRLEQDNKPQD